MKLSEMMTTGVVTAPADAAVGDVAQQMRDASVGSVVVVDSAGSPVGLITDRDLALRVLAESRPLSDRVEDHCSKPLVGGEPDLDLEEAAALMVQHRVRRLPVLDDGELVGIVTLDDIAVRTGNLEVAQKMTAEVIEGALPEFFFHERG